MTGSGGVRIALRGIRGHRNLGTDLEKRVGVFHNTAMYGRVISHCHSFNYATLVQHAGVNVVVVDFLKKQLMAFTTVC
jgi:hypothetical protein